MRGAAIKERLMKAEGYESRRAFKHMIIKA
jgi:hypothetical protein